ncbi:hypothetical protein [Amnibacterium kyonggiense]|uniref:Tfp pilus assembly protein PilO n=1 Tax=Amnibacterium kyonggiense TaxID=595671 RepID=A0A4R7FQP6_9MICO|nr:hypothetical protein [Amnibacterium kyonggiense]TDS80111.1 Tfp pilus assembly protein PilO [Amnibacterium kyonggiense]
MTVNLRIWGIASGAAVVAVLAGGWFLGVQPQLAAAATSAQAAVNVDAQNQATQIKIAALTKAAAKLDEMKVQDAVLQKNVPTVLKPNTFIRRVTEVAALDGVNVVSITPGDAAAYTAPASASGQAGASPTGSIPLAKTSPLITGTNLAVVPVSIVVSGGPDAVVQFSHDIQNDERTFAINGVQTVKNDQSSTITGTFSGFIYVLKR